MRAALVVAATGIVVILAVTALVVWLTWDGRTTGVEALTMVVAAVGGIGIQAAVCIWLADRV